MLSKEFICSLHNYKKICFLKLLSSWIENITLLQYSKTTGSFSSIRAKWLMWTTVDDYQNSSSEVLKIYNINFLKRDFTWMSWKENHCNSNWKQDPSEQPGKGAKIDRGKWLRWPSNQFPRKKQLPWKQQMRCDLFYLSKPPGYPTPVR